MKNIHILSTDQPSRLHYYVFGSWSLSKEPLNWRTASYIYITSDEEIKESNWYLNIEEKNGIKNPFYGKPYKANQSICKVPLDYLVNNLKKIIITTDPTLIADGIQAIDDEFLEWFVKNPTCEFVEVQKWTNYSEVKYKLIIPQEEPKQDWYCPKCKSYVSSESVTFEEIHQICNTSVIVKEEPKQETLEEAAEKLAPNSSWRLGFIAGGKHMAEKMYSEEEVLNILHDYRNHFELYRNIQVLPDMFFPWFEQFKKK
ncbi:MAG: hypothetical protein RIR01_2322 [Bacteroidota bacterium]|jgi:hypothetical protein